MKLEVEEAGSVASLPAILAETKVNPAVGGEQREKSGLGVTVDGKERVNYYKNPWTELAGLWREIERARRIEI